MKKMLGLFEESVPGACNKLPKAKKSCSSRQDCLEVKSSSCILDKLRKDTQQLIEHSEQLVQFVTHLCVNKYSSVFRPRFSKENGIPQPCKYNSIS